ncbi:MAG: hypothetical protein WCJ58_03645 [bacterium]
MQKILNNNKPTTDLENDFKSNWNLIFVTIIITILIIIVTITAYLFKNHSEKQIINSETSISLKFIKFQNLPTLEFGHYTLWFVDGSKQFHLIKRFNVKSDKLISLDGTNLQSLSINSLSDIQQAVITIEQEGDRNEVPNTIIFLTSNYQLDNDMKFTLNDQLPELNKTEISFQLQTPTDQNTQINEQSGIWFVATSANILPVITTTGWSYQARLIYKAVYDLNIGYFNDLNNKDNSSRFSLAIDNPPNYPGEDFLTNLPDELFGPLNLTNGNSKVIISIEPMQDDLDPTGSKLFLPILEATIAEKTEIHVNYPMQNIYQPPELVIKTVHNSK